ncbi:MAG: hypothetical protein BGO69_02520 [Bacteroidetes bacterium 46-16]|nr:MAG: hypothetical protein BGO69_02520 [Bacteroidetes bacterium 46-16]
MKKFSPKAVLMIGALGMSFAAIAGNKDRTGQAGATELLVNPWGQSTGLFGMNVSGVKGLEAMKCNIAGMAFTDNMEIGVSHTIYLSGSQVSVNNIGISKKMGNFGAIGANIMAMSFGSIDITDYDHPEGGIGTYSPSFYNIELGYSKTFSNSIHAGVGVTLVSEQITNAHASGAAFEAGVQYVTGKRDNFHFGITLRNIGTNMRFSGSGFSINSDAPENANYQLNRTVPSEKFEMPTYLSMGASYDFFLDENHLKSENDKPKHRLSVLINFTSNSFINDYIGGGLEYSFHDMLMLRGGYRYEKGIGSDNSVTMYTGVCAGATIQHGIGENGPILALDYSYRPTARPANGVHTISLRLMTRNKRAKTDDED